MCIRDRNKAGLFGTDMFGEMGQKGDDVVLGDGLDLVNPRNVKGRCV